MSDVTILHFIINSLTVPNIVNQSQVHKFSNHGVHRFLTTLSNLDIFASDLVTHIMKKLSFPHIPSIFFGCVGTPPKTWLTGIILKKVDVLYPTFYALQAVKELLEKDDLTYGILQMYITATVRLEYLHHYLINHELLEQLVMIAVFGAVGYGKGLKKAPCLSINFIRYALYVYRLSGVVDDDIYEALLLSRVSICQDAEVSKN